MSWIERIGRWLRAQVQEVPEAIAVCEFDCSRTECRMGDWECCERRHNPLPIDSAPSASRDRAPVAAPKDF